MARSHSRALVRNAEVINDRKEVAMRMSEAEQRLHAKLSEWYGGYLALNFPEWHRPPEPSPADLGLDNDDELMEEAFHEGWSMKVLRFHYHAQEEALKRPWRNNTPPVVKPPARS
jgi:hypothetical protein